MVGTQLSSVQTLPCSFEWVNVQLFPPNAFQVLVNIQTIFPSCCN